MDIGFLVGVTAWAVVILGSPLVIKGLLAWMDWRDARRPWDYEVSRHVSMWPLALFGALLIAALMALMMYAVNAT